MPGDLSKAFGGGADFVMIGGMLAGHDESAGEVVVEDGVKCKHFYGMSSKTAMEKHSGSVAEYRASEGKHVKVCAGFICGDVFFGLGKVITLHRWLIEDLCVTRFWTCSEEFALRAPTSELRI